MQNKEKEEKLIEIVALQEQLIATLKDGVELRDNVIEKYEETIELQEEKIEIYEEQIDIYKDIVNALMNKLVKGGEDGLH